jgi:hypothetical protein
MQSTTTRSLSVPVCAIALASPISAFAARPQAHASSVKYRDAGVKPATGRFGTYSGSDRRHDVASQTGRSGFTFVLSYQ